jgi:uncharacterized protein YbaA (DUF1428 family)
MRVMTYVDGMIVPVQKKKLAAYRAMSKKFGKVCREHGALEYRESVADDVKVAASGRHFRAASSSSPARR